MRPFFPPVFDSTMIADFRSCMYKGYLSHIEHWKSQTGNVNLIAGGAFASGMCAMRKAFFDDCRHPDDALAAGIQALIEHYGDFECPADSPKSLERMMGALEYYTQVWPLQTDYAPPVRMESGKHAVEMGFAVPLPIQHPELKTPLLYVGRFDAAVHHAGKIMGADEKTTKSLGASWARQWELRSQFTAYTWGGRQLGFDIQGMIVRGISILKTKYDTAECVTYRPQWEIDRWYNQMLRDISRIMDCWEEGYWDYNLDSGCTSYGSCQFSDVCKSFSPEDYLKMAFEQQVWDATQHKTISVEEWKDRWLGVDSARMVELAYADAHD